MQSYEQKKLIAALILLLFFPTIIVTVTIILLFDVIPNLPTKEDLKKENYIAFIVGVIFCVVFLFALIGISVALHKWLKHKNKDGEEPIVTKGHISYRTELNSTNGDNVSSERRKGVIEPYSNLGFQKDCGDSFSDGNILSKSVPTTGGKLDAGPTGSLRSSFAIDLLTKFDKIKDTFGRSCPTTEGKQADFVIDRGLSGKYKVSSEDKPVIYCGDSFVDISLEDAVEYRSATNTESCRQASAEERRSYLQSVDEEGYFFDNTEFGEEINQSQLPGQSDLKQRVGTKEDPVLSSADEGYIVDAIDDIAQSPTQVWSDSEDDGKRRLERLDTFDRSIIKAAEDLEKELQQPENFDHRKDSADFSDNAFDAEGAKIYRRSSTQSSFQQLPPLRDFNKYLSFVRLDSLDSLSGDTSFGKNLRTSTTDEEKEGEKPKEASSEEFIGVSVSTTEGTENGKEKTAL